MKFHSAKEFVKNKKVLFFLFGTFFFMMSLAASYSVVPVFLIHQKATLTQVGISTAIYSLSAVILTLLLGPISDRIGRKFLLVLSATSFVISWILIWIAPTFELHLIARAIQAIGLALYMPTGSSVVSDLVEPKVIGSCMGIYRGFLGMGFAVGPVLSLLLIKTSFALMFIGNISMAFVALVLLLNIPKTGVKSKIKNKLNLFSNYLYLLKNRKLLRYYLLVLTITSGHGIIMANSAIFIGGLKGVINPSIFLFSIFGLGMFASLFGGWFIDKFGIKKVIIPAVILALSGFLLMSSIERVGNSAIFFVIMGIGLGTNSTVISAIAGIGRETRKDLKATSFAIEESAYNGGIAIGNFIFGFLASGLGFSYGFLIIGIILGLSYMTIFLTDYFNNKKSLTIT